MAEFNRFSDLPSEIRLQIWEAAIPRSPSVHFLSYPKKRGPTTRTYQWQSELVNVNRTINVSNDPTTNKPDTRTKTWGRYSSYLARLTMLHACKESRNASLAYAASCTNHVSNSPTFVSTKNRYTLDQEKDVICIQDPDSRFPWNAPRYLDLTPKLDPMRIALECRPYLDCNVNTFAEAPDELGDWVTELAGGSHAVPGFGTSIGIGDYELALKAIYVLSYGIKPKYAIVGETSGISAGGSELASGVGEKQPDPSTEQSPGQAAEYSDKFHGHGVMFYAISAKDAETCTGWNIPQEAWDFYHNICAHTQHRYGFAVVDSLEEAKKEMCHICIEFLACVKA
ncbi:hypothetical protein J7T55_004519 [Diaporthe amygdali]|uniref:uncharacterized protein n=1 Tax=Phomopsis amygdali TaxID=1214568 RepID=UPI0022FEF1FC|nr:uncharacterized protein J7T55_004519 [Diaporthe amygdali]KAJ0114778.1 hypothetical protein J7T55_004519 [Diaporthe amygdali]